MSSFLMVHVSDPYSTKLHINVFIIRFFKFLFIFGQVVLRLNASFPSAVLLISLWHLASVVIILLW